MDHDVQLADVRLRRVTAIALTLAAVAAALCVLAFQHWIAVRAERLSTPQLVSELRRWVGAAMAAASVCLLLLAGHAGRTARRIGMERRWPPAAARVLRDTPVRRDRAAARIRVLYMAAALLLIALALGAAAASWRLFASAV
jgi:hypothetical protein